MVLCASALSSCICAKRHSPISSATRSGRQRAYSFTSSDAIQARDLTVRIGRRELLLPSELRALNEPVAVHRAPMSSSVCASARRNGLAARIIVTLHAIPATLINEPPSSSDPVHPMAGKSPALPLSRALGFVLSRHPLRRHPTSNAATSFT